MMKIALILAVLPALTFADRISFWKCKDGGPMPNWVSVEGCYLSDCPVEIGAEFRLSAELSVTVPAKTITTRGTASWKIFNQELDLPSDVRNGCNSFPGGCPLKVGTTQTMNASFVATSPISNITPTIEIIMTNESGERVMCLRTNVRLVR